MANYEFIAELSGNGQCECFKISKIEYIKIFGIENYDKKIYFIQENNKLMTEQLSHDKNGTKLLDEFLEDENPEFFYITISDLIKYKNKDLLNIKLSYDVLA